MSSASAAALHEPRRARVYGKRPIRVMIVDDSAVARAVLSRMVTNDGGFEVVVEAAGAQGALDALRSTLVDIVLLDVEMPGTSGLAALPDILREGRGARVLIVSSLAEDGAASTLEALRLGAADTLPKPGSGRMNGTFSTQLLAKLRLIGHAKSGGSFPIAASAAPPAPGIGLLAMPASKLKCLAVGASTGGIHALASLFGALPPRIGVPILITQHLPHVFMPTFARQLERVSTRKCVVAKPGTQLEPDLVVIAPGDAHLGLRQANIGAVVELSEESAPSGCLPSLDPMFEAVARIYGPGGLGVVLTGMGRDGECGAASLAALGGAVIVQDEQSSAVWGMPRAIAQAGLASEVLDPAGLARCIAARAAV